VLEGRRIAGRVGLADLNSKACADEATRAAAARSVRKVAWLKEEIVPSRRCLVRRMRKDRAQAGFRCSCSRMRYAETVETRLTVSG